MKYKHLVGLFCGITAYYASFVVNYSTHIGDALNDAVELKNYPVLGIESLLLMDHQGKCLEELESPWLFVPGSFLWRRVERPPLSPIPPRTPGKTKKTRTPTQILI